VIHVAPVEGYTVYNSIGQLVTGGGKEMNDKMPNPDDIFVFPFGHRAESVSYMGGGLPSVFGGNRWS
jgi:hypothetical protein